MKRLTGLQNEIVISLYLLPGTLEDISSREFLNGITEANVDRLLWNLEREKKIYCRVEKYYAYKRYVKTELSEYLL